MLDSATGNWQAKSSLPAAGIAGASCFVINDTAYIIGGRTSSAFSVNKVWAYCFSTDTWTEKNNLPFGCSAGVLLLQNKMIKVILIFGRDENNRYCKELFEFDPTT